IFLWSCACCGVRLSLFCAQRDDGVEAGGTAGGVEAEDDSDSGSEAEGEEHGQRREHERGAAEEGVGKAAADAKNDADSSTEAAEHDGFDEKLSHNIAWTRSDGHADADFTRALGDGDKHDIHNTDATHNQR